MQISNLYIYPEIMNIINQYNNWKPIFNESLKEINTDRFMISKRYHDFDFYYSELYCYTYCGFGFHINSSIDIYSPLKLKKIFFPQYYIAPRLVLHD